MKKAIVTIGRQFGSGGRQIGKRLAELLNIPYYDRELITEAARKSGVSEEYFQKIDETAASSLLYTLSAGSYMMGTQMASINDLPANDRLYVIQSEIIREKAAQGPCVLVGRCADYILRDHPERISVFIHAGDTFRLKRIVEEYGADPKKAPDIMRRTDKKRAQYYHYYTDGKWSDAANYQLTFDRSLTGIEGGAALICSFIEHAHPLSK